MGPFERALGKHITRRLADKVDGRHRNDPITFGQIFPLLVYGGFILYLIFRAIS